MREIIKEFALGTSCPVDISELKNLGIDMASAPAAVPSGYGTGRRCDFALKNSFTPTWVENKAQKPKPYYGRGSDRSGHGIRGDQKRKSSVRLPNIDRPPREPVKLHKAEHAWRPDIGKKDNDKVSLGVIKNLYKQIRGLLNKITPSTFDSLSEEFLRYKCYQNKENMNEIINIIFDKAVEEPKFCPLYSDLCKKQVLEEMKDSKISEFRSGILTRCQQTFEKNKCQSEIDKKKKEAEEEQDVNLYFFMLYLSLFFYNVALINPVLKEKKKKELKVEVMELEAKDRRRMFGNIGFIGQLYRHGLIVPKILKWCIIHLLKNHSETAGGDEESIECAVRMLETVGKIVDLQQQNSDFQQSCGIDWNAYFLHLKELSTSVSNRIRFLILNLIELRENKWNPRKSTDSGPMTIAAVHDEARKEEMQAKLAREQYDKARKPYDGRPSLDRRRALVGRQSQDNRFYGKGDQSRDLKNRNVGQTTHSSTASSRKNQTLSTVDQPGKLGYRKGAFNLGSSGGSGQDGRKSSVASFRGAGRGLVTSRENSEPSSREPSESRKHSVAGDRLDRNLITAQTLPRPRMPTSASASCLSVNLEVSRSSAHSDEEERLQPTTLSEEQERKLLLTFSNDLHEYFENPAKQVNEAFQALDEIVSKSSVSTAFRLLMRVGVEKIGSKEEEKMHRQYLGRALCLFLQNTERKGKALQGITDFCNYAVSTDLWQEIPLLWDWVAEIISWSIMCDTNDVEGERPSLNDFKEPFLASEKDTRKAHELLVSTLYHLAEIDESREGHTSSAAMMFEELKGLDSPSLRDALRAKMFHSDASLYDTLLI
uniref:MIF4G domain-containing protein n=1 Tax=Syphacia muris TaxID=451379 RepID=A0A0N5ABE5_9BILA